MIQWDRVCSSKELTQAWIISPEIIDIRTLFPQLFPQNFPEAFWFQISRGMAKNIDGFWIGRNKLKEFLKLIFEHHKFCQMVGHSIKPQIAQVPRLRTFLSQSIFYLKHVQKMFYLPRILTIANCSNVYNTRRDIVLSRYFPSECKYVLVIKRRNSEGHGKIFSQLFIPKIGVLSFEHLYYRGIIHRNDKNALSLTHKILESYKYALYGLCITAIKIVNNNDDLLYANS